MNLRSLVPPKDRSAPARLDNFFFGPIDRLLEQISQGAINDVGNIVPRIDVVETDKSIELTAELPGLEEDDVEISLVDNVSPYMARSRPSKNARTRTITSRNASMALSIERSSCRQASIHLASRRRWQTASSGSPSRSRPGTRPRRSPSRRETMRNPAKRTRKRPDPSRDLETCAGCLFPRARLKASQRGPWTSRARRSI